MVSFSRMMSQRKAVMLVPFPRKLASIISILQQPQVSWDEKGMDLCLSAHTSSEQTHLRVEPPGAGGARELCKEALPAPH